MFTNNTEKICEYDIENIETNSDLFTDTFLETKTNKINLRPKKLIGGSNIYTWRKKSKRKGKTSKRKLKKKSKKQSTIISKQTMDSIIPTPQNRDYVFVYGSLREGGTNYNKIANDTRLKKIGFGTTKEKYSFIGAVSGAYPYASKSIFENVNKVHIVGELYEVLLPGVFSELDALEYNYTREKIEVLVNGEVYETYIYLLKDPELVDGVSKNLYPNGRKRFYNIKSGDWFDKDTECKLEDDKSDCEWAGGMFVGTKTSDSENEVKCGHPIGTKYIDGELCPWTEFPVIYDENGIQI